MFFQKKRHSIIASYFAMLSSLGVTILFGVSLGPRSIAQAKTTNQSAAQKEAEVVNKKGSDESMEHATTNAMRALMHLAEAQYAPAFANGYKAYGNYTNSEDLDDMAAQNNALKNRMQSNGNGGAGPEINTRTSFRRLNPRFLEIGEAGKVAAEFEKKTGMSRQKFLQVLSDASEQDLFVDDPDVLAKSFSKFEQFVQTIPNKKFRDKIRASVNKVPAPIRSGALVKAISNLTPSWAMNFFKKNENKSPASPDVTIKNPAGIEADQKSGIPESDSLEAVTSIPSTELEQVNPIEPETPKKGMVGLAYDSVDPFLASLIYNSKVEQKNSTKEDSNVHSLFEQVSQFYRGIESQFR